jgi:hypothetical protein
MTASITGGSTSSTISHGGAPAFTFDQTGLLTGVNKAAVSQMPTLGTAVATTSGTNIDFVGIPSWVKRITVSLSGVSTSGISEIQFRLGTIGGVEITGYLGLSSYIAAGSAGSSSYTTGFGMYNSVLTTSNRHGAIVFTLIGSNNWSANGLIADTIAGTIVNCPIAGSKALSGTLDRIRLTTVNGTDTFDAGSVNILYE